MRSNTGQDELGNIFSWNGGLRKRLSWAQRARNSVQSDGTGPNENLYSISKVVAPHLVPYRAQFGHSNLPFWPPGWTEISAEISILRCTHVAPDLSQANRTASCLQRVLFTIIPTKVWECLDNSLRTGDQNKKHCQVTSLEVSKRHFLNRTGGGTSRSSRSAQLEKPK